jgi:hypothetical protein
VAAHIADRCKITQSHQWISGRFDVNHASLRADRAFDVSGIRRIHVREFHSVAGEDIIKQARHATIKIVATHDVITGLVHGAKSIDCCHATSEDTRSDPSFERSKIPF